jgi:hypothetical protein
MIIFLFANLDVFTLKKLGAMHACEGHGVSCGNVFSGLVEFDQVD